MSFSINTGNRTPMAEINVTPLVDVMLVLLIIFMVTAPMMQEGVSVDLPEAKGTAIPSEQTKHDIIISVSAAGKILVNETEVAEDKLLEKVTEARKEESAGDVLLRADKSVPHGTVVRIMAALMSAGVKNLGIITSPQEDGRTGK
jgi:biopolymer transport protein TolR